MMTMTLFKKCPKCGDRIEVVYGEMGEGQVYESTCRCNRTNLLLEAAAWIIFFLIVVALIGD